MSAPNPLKVLVLLGSSSDLPVTADGTELFKQLLIPYTLRICSAHRSPAMLHDLVREFEGQGGQLFVCVAGMSAHLAGVVASLTLKPVLAVPVHRAETAGLDALLSMSQMPKGVPVSTMGFGRQGFANAALTAAQIFALTDTALAGRLADDRAATVRRVAADDQAARQEYRG